MNIERREGNSGRSFAAPQFPPYMFRLVGIVGFSELPLPEIAGDFLDRISFRRAIPDEPSASHPGNRSAVSNAPPGRQSVAYDRPSLR
ncbi:hypothetical protein ACFYTQ_25145 [Nocardia sp. NPDC004068]|uniref:hypothetical protein n=1 Tax=Nocardia sp. NPDC004068 TaxID=3364303 RepID=UPI00368EEF17